MKYFSAMPLFFATLLASTLAACGSSPNGSTGPAGPAGPTGNDISGPTGNANTTTSNTINTSVSVTGNLGVSFTGKDAVYATGTVQGVTIATVVVSDSTGLCASYGGGNLKLTGTVMVIELLNGSGDFASGDYAVEDPNTFDPLTTQVPTADVGIAIGGLVTHTGDPNAATQNTATGGDVNVTAYAANGALTATINMNADGASGVKGTITAAPCAALSAALQAEYDSGSANGADSTGGAKKLGLVKLFK